MGLEDVVFVFVKLFEKEDQSGYIKQRVLKQGFLHVKDEFLAGILHLGSYLRGEVWLCREDEHPVVLYSYVLGSTFAGRHTDFLLGKNLCLLSRCSALSAHLKLVAKVIPVRDSVIREVLLGRAVLKEKWAS